MADRIELVQGDTRPRIIFTVTDSATGKAADLSDVTSPKLKFRAKGASVVKETLTCTLLPGLEQEDGTIDLTAPYNTPGKGGRVELAWSVSSLDQAGDFEGELELTFSDGTIQTVYEPYRFKIRPQF